MYRRPLPVAGESLKYGEFVGVRDTGCKLGEEGGKRAESGHS